VVVRPALLIARDDLVPICFALRGRYRTGTPLELIHQVTLPKYLKNPVEVGRGHYGLVLADAIKFRIWDHHIVDPIPPLLLSHADR